MNTLCAWCAPGSRGSHGICERHARELVAEARELASEEEAIGGRVAIRFQSEMDAHAREELCKRLMEPRDGEPLATPWDAPRGFVRPVSEGKRPEQVAYSALVLLGVALAGIAFGILVALSRWGGRL